MPGRQEVVLARRNCVKKKCHCLTEFPLGEARGQGRRALGCHWTKTRDQRPEREELVYGDKGRKILGKT